MPFDGSGNFVRTMDWTNDAAASIKIRADRHDNHDDDIAAGLSNTITKNGQTTITADIPFNGKKITNLGAPTTANDAATKAYADSIRNFATGITLTGGSTGTTPNFVSTAFVGFTEADMSIVARKADPAATPPTVNRLVVNDKADGTGRDILTIREDGRATAIVVITANTTWNKSDYPGVTHIKLRGVGGGGAGGGGTGVNPGAGAGAGGGSGCYGETPWLDVSAVASIAIVIGQGGASTGLSGNNGSGTTAIVGSTTYTWLGGLGGQGANGRSTQNMTVGGAPRRGESGSAAYPSTLLIAISSGGELGVAVTDIAVGGQGGSSPWGAGGGATRAGVTTEANNGVAGSGYGAGGSGYTVVASTAARVGGAGSDGRIEIEMRIG